MLGLHDIKVIIFPDVQKGKETAINPSTTLFHQIFMIFHRIGICNSIRYISKIVLLFCLTIDSKTENSIFC